MVKELAFVASTTLLDYMSTYCRLQTCIHGGGIAGKMFLEFPPNLMQCLLVSLLAMFSLQMMERYPKNLGGGSKGGFLRRYCNIHLLHRLHLWSIVGRKTLVYKGSISFFLLLFKLTSISSTDGFFFALRHF